MSSTTNNFSILELPEKTFFSRKETAQILGIGLSTLDSLIPYSELPRFKIHKRVYVARGDLETYLMSCRMTGGTNIPYQCSVNASMIAKRNRDDQNHLEESV